MKELSEIAQRNSWDGAAILAVMSLETGGTLLPDAGADDWSPRRTAIGLLQWVEGALKSLHVPETSVPPREHLREYPGKWRTWNVAGFRVSDQLELAEKFYRRAFERKGPSRPVDYYLAAWGAAPALGLGTVLAVKGDGLYERNQSLDYDGDGKIQVKDLARMVRQRMGELAAMPAERAPAVIPSTALTLPGVALTIGFKVLQRRMVLL